MASKKKTATVIDNAAPVQPAAPVATQPQPAAPDLSALLAGLVGMFAPHMAALAAATPAAPVPQRTTADVLNEANEARELRNQRRTGATSVIGNAKLSIGDLPAYDAHKTEVSIKNGDGTERDGKLYLTDTVREFVIPAVQNDFPVMVFTCDETGQKITFKPSLSKSGSLMLVASDVEINLPLAGGKVSVKAGGKGSACYLPVKEFRKLRDAK